MADNVQAATVSNGGAVFASDATTSGATEVHYPISKLCWGALNAIELISDTASQALPVKIWDGGNVITVGNATAADLNVTLGAGSDAVGKLAANSGVDIGDVDVTSVIPGTGATNLGKAEDAAHSSGDVGVAAMTVRQDEAVALSGADGDYQPLISSEHGCLHVDPQHYHEVDGCNSTSGWSIFNDDTENLATDSNHVFETLSLSFDKLNGAGDTTVCGIDRSITPVSFNKHMEEGGGFVLWAMYVPSLTNVDYVYIRLGTDDSNYNEWRIQDSDITEAIWNNFRAPLASPDTYAGDGWDSGAVAYVCVGAVFDNQANALAGILTDAIFVNSGLQVSADITSQITSEVSSPNVNVKKWGATNVTTDQGNSDAGTLRVAISDDDTNLAILAGAVSTQMQCDIVAELPAGNQNIGNVDIVTVPAPLSTTGAGTEAAAQRVTIANDSTGVLSIDDNGGVITVGNATAADLNTTEVNSGGIKTSVDTIAAAVSTQMQCDIVGALPAGSAAIGKLAANTGVDIGDVDILSLPASTNTLEVVGDVAEGVAVAGNPVLMGVEARSTEQATVSDGDAAHALADTTGKQVVLLGACHDLHVNGKATYTDDTGSDIIAAGAAGVKYAIMSILVTNADTTVSTLVSIRDGSTVTLIGNAVAEGGFALNGGGHPLFIGTAATAIEGICGTTGAQVEIFASGYSIEN